jgi:hypothetical protein
MADGAASLLEGALRLAITNYNAAHPTAQLSDQAVFNLLVTMFINAL